ncbi:MAG: hypothetical protein HYY24_13495 [Verrucomicrobia bacterium]|nr:hypothetical protein [Verrucomicrobiota bacterium]
MLNYLSVAAGGALGSVARFRASSLAARYLWEPTPVGTPAVNVTRSITP